MNIRPQDKEHALGNELTSLFVELPVTEEDPIARYHRVVERAEELKRGSQRPGARRSSTSLTWARRSPAPSSHARCSAAPGCSI